MVICLGWPSPATSSSLPAASGRASRLRRIGRCGSHLAAYLALLRLGVAVPLAVARSAVGSYPTVSPLPSADIAPASRRPRGVLLSVALSVASRRPGVTWQSTLGARTFLEGARAPPRPSRPTRGSKLTPAGPGGSGRARAVRHPSAADRARPGLTGG